MRRRARIMVWAALLGPWTAATGCSGGSSGGSSAGTTAAPLTVTHGPDVTGRVADAPAETLVHLLGPVNGAATLASLAEAVHDSQPLTADGGFRLQRLEAGPHRVLVSAPGRALTWVDAPEDRPLSVTLAPEARLALTVLGPDGPAALATALVLDAQGAPLPISVEEAVGDEQGHLSVGRLPAGRLELLVLSLDLGQVARAELDLTTGQTLPLELTLSEDPPLLARALELAGLSELAALARGEEGVQ